MKACKFLVLVLLVLEILPTQISLYVHNTLLVPSITKNLPSVNKLALDNGAYFEFYPHNYIVKSQATSETLLRPPNT